MHIRIATLFKTGNILICLDESGSSSTGAVVGGVIGGIIIVIVIVIIIVVIYYFIFYKNKGTYCSYVCILINITYLCT